MARTSPQITIEEIPGEGVQNMDAARLSLASDLAKMVKQMIEQGALEIRDNKILPRGQRA